MDFQGRTELLAKLGEGGAVLAGERDFLVGDVGGLGVEDPVSSPGPDSGGNILRVQQFPGLLRILDGSVDTVAQDLVAELALERLLHIPPGTRVCTDRGI